MLLLSLCLESLVFFNVENSVLLLVPDFLNFRLPLLLILVVILESLHIFKIDKFLTLYAFFFLPSLGILHALLIYPLLLEAQLALLLLINRYLFVHLFYVFAHPANVILIFFRFIFLFPLELLL